MKNNELDPTQKDLIANNPSGNAWILATKKEGDLVAGWTVAERFVDQSRLLSKSERCQITSFCYPRGAKLVRALLAKAPENEINS